MWLANEGLLFDRISITKQCRLLWVFFSLSLSSWILQLRRNHCNESSFFMFCCVCFLSRFLSKKTAKMIVKFTAITYSRHRWARGVSGGVDPHLFRFFMTPPPKVQIDPTPSWRAFWPPRWILDFWLTTFLFLEKKIWKIWPPKKIFAGFRRPKYFSRKSPNHAKNDCKIHCNYIYSRFKFMTAIKKDGN